jgi:hypothetical protein
MTDWIDVEIRMISRNKKFLEDGSNQILNLLNNPYNVEDKKKSLHRKFKASIGEMVKVPKMTDLYYMLNIKPDNKYDVTTFKEDLRMIYTLCKGVSLAYGDKFDKIEHKVKDGIVTETIGVLNLIYPFEKRLELYKKNKEDDFLCFMSKLNEVFPEIK